MQSIISSPSSLLDVMVVGVKVTVAANRKI